MSRSGFSVALVALMTSPGWALAQSADTRVQASISVPAVLTVSAASSTMTFPVAGVEDFERGYVELEDGVVVAHAGNVPHDLQVVAAEPWLFSESGEAQKSISDLEVQADDAGGFWQGLSVEPLTLRSVAAGRHDEGGSLRYRLLLQYATDTPASYSVDLTYLVVAR